MDEEKNVKNNFNTSVKFRGGSLGLGDPENKQLRKVEKDILIPKRLKEEATLKCSNLLQQFLNCAGKTGLAVVIKCREENENLNTCVAKWMKDDELIKQVTEQYLYERTYYRKTGKPLNIFLKKKSQEQKTTTS